MGLSRSNRVVEGGGTVFDIERYLPVVFCDYLEHLKGYVYWNLHGNGDPIPEWSVG